MAANALEAIKLKEAEAKTIRSQAMDEAQKKLSDADAEGRALIEQARKDAAAEKSRAMQAAEKKSDKIRADANVKAKQKATALTVSALKNCESAEKLILERISLLWQ